MITQGIVFNADAQRPWLAARSVRSLKAAGMDEVRIIHRDDEASWKALASSKAPLVLLRAGAWLRRRGPLVLPAGSSTGQGVMALGLPFSGEHAAAWRDERQRSGGHFSSESLPPCLCGYLDEKAITDGALRAFQISTPLPCRIVHWPALDIDEDARHRCLQIVTSLQHGGAERVALDLANELPRQGIPTRLVVLGRPMRRTLPEPEGMMDLSQLNRDQRSAAMQQVAALFGADVLHGHLIDAEDARRFSALGWPVVMTLHNTRAAWPEGLETLQTGDAALLIACAQAVETELRTTPRSLPIRTVWNGIVAQDRTGLSVCDEQPASMPGLPFTIACIANPRPQKRLHLLPSILAATRAAFLKQGIDRDVRLIIAGETSPLSPTAVECMKATLAEAVRLGVAKFIHVTEGREEVSDVLARSQALVSCSAHEGLSLAHLEGLAAGLPLVTTDAGGTRELAWQNPSVTLLALEASALDFATALTNLCLQPPPSGRERMMRDFTTPRMAERCAWLYQRVMAPTHTARGLWFITNNLSTGGAQSSLRRLARRFHEQGVAVRVAVLQEEPDHPTPGRRDLIAAGIQVIALPPAGSLDAADAVAELLIAMDADPAECVVFWNAIPVYKVLIADALLTARIFDVSPGEMFYASLDRYFANPRAALPYRAAKDYGARLTGVIVKYEAEAEQAVAVLGAHTHVIPNGVVMKPMMPKRRCHETRLVIGTAARINPQKRLEDLLAAFRLALPNLPPCVLQIAGDVEIHCEDYAAQLHALSEGLPIEWLGEVQDIAAFHANLDLFVMISEPAGCPNASLEALASGLPVIATDVGGASEQVLDGFNGRLVPARDDAAFAAALVELTHDPAQRQRMGKTARQHVQDRFDMERMFAAYASVLLPFKIQLP